MPKKPAKPAVKKTAARGKAAPKVVKRAAKPVVKPVAKKKAKARRPESARAAKLKLFVAEYLRHNFNGTKACIAIGYAPGAARFEASKVLALPAVRKAVDEEIAARAARLQIDTDDVLKRMHAIATADPRELIELHRCCCRFCYGKDHDYQWTRHELREAMAQYAKDVKACKGDKDKLGQLTEPNPAGGEGFNPYKDPSPACPECFGEGTERVVPKDTRDLSPTAQLLYAGVKTTQSGLEIKMHDQTGMLVNIGKHLGMFEKKVKHSGDVTVHQSVTDLLDAIDGAGTGLPNHASRGD